MKKFLCMIMMTLFLCQNTLALSIPTKEDSFQATENEFSKSEKNVKTSEMNYDLLKFSSLILGFSEEDLQEKYIQEGEKSFMEFFDEMINSISEYEITTKEYDYSTENCKSLIKKEYNIDDALIAKCIEKLGSNYVLKRLNIIEPNYKNAPLLRMSSTDFNRYYNNAHTGNIFITKDSYTMNYRDGHVGIIQKHLGGEKMITEALGDGDKSTYQDDVQVRKLRQSWQGKITLAVYYPKDEVCGGASVREKCGEYSKIFDSDKYGALTTKDYAMKYMQSNCATLVWEAYYDNYLNGKHIEIVPQVGMNSVVLPSHIAFSGTVNLKTEGGIPGAPMLRTSNWLSYDWGF